MVGLRSLLYTRLKLRPDDVGVEENELGQRANLI